MNPWLGKIAILLGVVILIAIRIPHARRGRKVTVVETRQSVRETALHVLIGFEEFRDIHDHQTPLRQSSSPV